MDRWMMLKNNCITSWMFLESTVKVAGTVYVLSDMEGFQLQSGKVSHNWTRLNLKIKFEGNW